MMRTWRKAPVFSTWVLLLLLFPAPARSQGGAGPPLQVPFPLVERFECFGVSDGLPSWKITCVLAAEGNVWAGTDQGLAVREGKRWRTIGPEDGLSHRLVSALSLAPGSGELWIGTFGGLNRLSGGRIDTFIQLNSGLPNDVVYGVEAAEDAVWVATAAGTGRLDRKSGAWSLFDHTNTIMHEPWCYALARSLQRIYVGVWGGGIVEHDPGQGTWKEYRDPDREMELDLVPDDGPIHDVTSSIAWADGILWQGTYFGLSRYDGTRWKTYLEGKSGLVSNFVNAVAARGSVAWLATDRGLGVTDGETWTNYRRGNDGGGILEIHRPGAPVEVRKMSTALPHEFVLGVWAGEGEVWAATEHGLARGILSAGPEGFAPPGLSQESSPAARTRAGGQ